MDDESSQVAGVPSILEPDLVSPSSTITLDIGQVIALPLETESAPFVPEHYRKLHKYTKRNNIGRRNCQAKGCNTRTPFKCFHRDVFCCNGEGKEALRWCIYSHICVCYKGDVNDTAWKSQFKTWEVNRAKV